MNTLAEKFDQLKLLIGKNIDILIQHKLKNAQFIIK